MTGDLAAVIGVEVSAGLSPKENDGTGKVDALVASVLDLGLSPPRLKVTVEALGLDCPRMEGGEEIAPVENGVAVVDVTEVSVAEGADVVLSAGLLASFTVVVVAPNENPPLLPAS